MAFARPTLTQLVTRIEADFVSRLPLNGSPLSVSMVRVLSRVLAGVAHMAYGAVDWVARQLFPDSSDDEFLVRQATLFGLSKNAASFAESPIVFTGDDEEVIPEGTILVRSDGARYETIGGDYEIDGDDITGRVRALEAGAAGTLTDAAILSFESPISGVDGNATVDFDDTEIDGADQETTEELRQRLRERMAAGDDVGGNEADYVAWAKQITGVTRVWVSPLELGAGTVVVRFVRDNESPIIPSGGEVTTVQNYIDSVKPAHADVTVIAPVDDPTAFTIAVTPDTAEVKAAVEAELEDLYRRVSEPGGTILLSAIQTAIGVAAGLTDYELTVPSANVVASANELPSVGTITWA